MKKKSLSLQKLPQIARQKKDKLFEKNEQFNEKLRAIEKLQIHNELMQLKLKPNDTMRTFKRQSQLKMQDRAHKLVSIITKHEKLLGSLQPIKEVQYKSQRIIVKPTSIIKTAAKRMDVEGFFKERDEKEIEAEMKLIEIQNNRRQYLPQVVESEKKTFPFYCETEKKYQEEPFVKLEEKEGKIKIRFLNNFQKWIKATSLKEIVQNQKLNLQTFRKSKGITEQPNSLANDYLTTVKQLDQKINIDSVFLNRMLNQVFTKKNPRQEIRAMLKQELYGNYEDSVRSFNRLLTEGREIKTINRFQRKNKVSAEIKNKIDHELVCSYNLQFLQIYMLSKGHYISRMVESYNIISRLQGFNHFSKLYIINNTPEFVEQSKLTKQLTCYFSDQKNKLQNIIFQLEQHLNVLVQIIHKDIEHIIFLNPRLEGTSYQQFVKEFITSFSHHLSRIIRSVIIQAINSQLQELIDFYRQYVTVQQTTVYCKQSPLTQFYGQVTAINLPIDAQRIGQKIVHGPGLIPIVFVLKKWKRKKYSNIFRFIIDSRKNIRQFSTQNWQNYINSEERILFKDPLQLLQGIILVPLSCYIKDVHQSQNVNGCILNKKIELSDFINIDRFKSQMQQLYISQRDQKIKMYAVYFQLWELYFMEKAYIDDFLLLYKQVHAIRLIDEEMKYLKEDLLLIQSFPNVIELQLIRLDITQIKQKIQTTINSFIKKLIKNSEETLQKLLQHGIEQTNRAKQLNQMTPYTNLAEYIEFINLINRKQVQKSIAQIATDVVFIDKNVIFLQSNQHKIKASMLKRYWQCGTWIRIIRRAANQNKKKMAVDPYSFLKGVKEKKIKIYQKYNKIIKEIVQMLKVNDLKNAMKMSGLANNLAHQMKQICAIADDIVKEQKLLQLQYAPKAGQKRQSDKIYRSDLTFFYKEEKFILKYLNFWNYASKLKGILQNINERLIIHIDGVQIVRLIREGQQLITSIKVSTLNKRFIQLCDQIHHQIDPFLKCSKLFLFIPCGSQHYRLKVIKQLSNQSSQPQFKKQPYVITVKDMMAWPSQSIDWQIVYKLREEDQLFQTMSAKLTTMYSVIKNTEANVVELRGVGRMRQFDMLIIDQQFIDILKYFIEVTAQMEESFSYIFRTGDQDDDLLAETVKKINIFYRSILKLKSAVEALFRYYSIFQLIYIYIQYNFQNSNLQYFYNIYQNMIFDVSKKTGLIKKLGFTTFYDDRVRLNYDEDLKKMQEFQIKFYNDVMPVMLQNYQFFSHSEIIKENIYVVLSSLGLSSLNESAVRLMGDWCMKVKLQLDYDKDYYFIILNEVETIYHQKISIKIKERLVQTKKYMKGDNEKLQIKCGLLTIIEKVNQMMSRKIQEQTIITLKLVYSLHYSTKSIFQLYLFINNLLFQPLLNTLILHFFMDLSLVYDSKYDLNILSTTIQQRYLYAPKQKQNHIYVDSILNLLEGFISIIDYLQEKQYSLDDHEKGRMKKMYAYNLIPKLIIHNYNQLLNKDWFNGIKQEKEDDFIFHTHLNPALQQFQLPNFDSSRIESRQVEKKDFIANLFSEELNIRTLLVSEKDELNVLSQINIEVVANVAPHLGIISRYIPFYFQIVNTNRSTNYRAQSYKATGLLIESNLLNKIFVTNIHPNYNLLGCNFTRRTKYEAGCSKHTSVVVTSSKQVITAMRDIIQDKRETGEQYIYIYYDRLDFSLIESQIVEEHAVVFDFRQKYHVNCQLKRSLTSQEYQVFSSFINSQLHFNKCLPLLEYPNKLLNANQLRFQLDLKERQLLMNLIWNYDQQQDFTPQITEQKMGIISHPLFILTKTHFILNYFFDLANYIYAKVNKDYNSDKFKTKQQLLTNWLTEVNLSHPLAIYILPVGQLTKEQLFTHVRYKQFQYKVQDRYKKSIQHIRTAKKPQIVVGFIQELIVSLVTHRSLGKRWHPFRIKGLPDAKVNWFVIDLSQQSSICSQVFDFFMQSYASDHYVFASGNHINVDFHFDQHLLKSHTHKLIFIINPSLLKKYQNDVPPIPVLNENMRFDPLKQFKIGLKNINQSFAPEWIKLIDFKSLIQRFKKAVSLIQLDNLSMQCLSLMNNILFMMVNQVRKREIALGHYSQSQLSLEESKNNLYGSIDLREKFKLTHQQQLELQEIQKKMDQVRRQIYKNYAQNQKYESALQQQTQQQLQTQFKYLSHSPHRQAQISKQLRKCVIFALYYSIILSHPNKRQQLSQQLVHLTHTKHLYNYCYCIQKGKWQLWTEVDLDLTAESCSPSVQNKILNAKQIIRHNHFKFKLQGMKDYVEEIDIIHNREVPIINVKSAEMFFSKMMTLYGFAIVVELSQDAYSNWTFQYELTLLASQSKQNQPPNRALPECFSNKKIQKMLAQCKPNIKSVKLIKQQVCNSTNWRGAVDYQIYRQGNEWYKISDNSFIFLQHFPSVCQQLPVIKLSSNQTSLSPFTLLTVIHNQNRFNDLQSNLQNVLLSLLTYHNKITFLQHYRFRQFILKNIQHQEMQQVYGLLLSIVNPDGYNEQRKKIKDIVNKIKLADAENKEEFTIEELQKIRGFNKIDQINSCLTKLLSCVKVERQIISNNFTLRYMLKKPKKYQKPIPLTQTKRRVKSPTKIQFDDILYLEQNYDRSNLISPQLTQPILFFDTRQKALLVHHTGPFTSKIKQKYLMAYRYYQRASQMMKANKNTKPFAVETNGIDQIVVNCKELELYCSQSLLGLEEEMGNEMQKSKVVVVYLFNLNLFDQMLDMLYRLVICNSRVKDHIYLLFTPFIEGKMHGLRTVVQSSQSDSNYLSRINQHKIETVKQKLQKIIKSRAKQQIQSSNIGTMYVSMSLNKLQEIKACTAYQKTQLDSKKQVFDKIQTQIASASRSIAQAQQLIALNDKSILQIQNDLFYWKLKRKYYTGQIQFKNINAEIRAVNRKKLEKEINRAEYLEDNSTNISYVYVFNILADNTYFCDKTTPLLDQEYELHKNYQIAQDQKKQFQKLLNYGRLNAIIDNDEIVFSQGLITQEQLTMSNKIRNQFVYLRFVSDRIFSQMNYNQANGFSLMQLLKQEMQMIEKRGDSQTTVLFNKYVVCLLCHKFIKWMTGPGIEGFQSNIKRLRESSGKLKQKIQHQEIRLSSNTSYLQQIKAKYSMNLKELETSKTNQQLFIKHANSNVTTIAQLYMKNYMGLDITYQYSITNKMKNLQTAKNDQKINKKAKRQSQDPIQQKQQPTTQNMLIQGRVASINDHQIINSIAHYFTHELNCINRRQLTNAQCQFILSILTKQTIQSIIESHHLQNIHQLYQQSFIVLAKLLQINYVVFDSSKYGDYSSILKLMDQRAFNIVDTTAAGRTYYHYFTYEMQGNYQMEVRGLLTRLENKKDILNNSLTKFVQKIQYIQPKSTESINKFILQSQTITNIEEFMSNALKTITNTAVQTMYYQGEWTMKNGLKVKMYSQVVEQVHQQLEEKQKGKISANVLIYYLRLIGMIGRKIGLQNIDQILEQLVYDHSSQHVVSKKAIIQTILTKRFSQSKTQTADPTIAEANNQISSGLSVISTLDSLLLINAKLLLVHGNEMFIKLLKLKCRQSNKLYRTKDAIAYYSQDNTSKEYLVLINVDPQLSVKQIVEQIVGLRKDIEWKDQNHMKFIVLFQSKSWRQDELNYIAGQVQPIYRFTYSNSPLSIYYHTHVQLSKQKLSHPSSCVKIAKTITQYYCPYLPHVPLQHIHTKQMENSQFSQFIQNMFDQYNLSPSSLEFKLFAMLCYKLMDIDQQYFDILKDGKNVGPYFSILQDEQELQQIKLNNHKTIQHQSQHFIDWLQNYKIQINQQPPIKSNTVCSIGLAQLMKSNTQYQSYQHSQFILSQAYSFLIVNKAFQRLFAHLSSKRHHNMNLPSFPNQQSHIPPPTTAVEIISKQSLFLQLFHESTNTSYELSNVMVDLSVKERSGSVGIYFRMVGCGQQWLRDIFGREMYMNVVGKKFKNKNQLKYVHGVLFKFSEPIIYVKKETNNSDFGEEQTNILKPLAQFKTILSVYTNHYEYIGAVQLTTNQAIDIKAHLVLQVSQ